MKAHIGFAVAALLAIGVAFAANAVFAHGGAKGVVKERMEKMERLDELMDRVFAMLRGEIPYDAGSVRKAAQEIEQSSGAKLTALFPEGSVGKPSEARPEIWRDFRRFRHFADHLGGLAANLAGQADTPGNASELPRKWEEVKVGSGMMGGGMMGGGMMRGQNGARAAAANLAAMCNACHVRFRTEK